VTTIADAVPGMEIKCPRCRGCGKVELTGETVRTFVLLLQLGGERYAAELHRLSAEEGIRPTTVNNRLSLLENHGLVTSRIRGRKRLFKASRPEQ